MKKFALTFLKNLAFVLLVLIFEISVLAFSCFDHTMFQIDDHATPFKASHAAETSSQENHGHTGHAAGSSTLECHLEVADGPSPSGSTFSVLGHEMISIDDLISPFFQPITGRLDELSLLIKELSLSPLEDPPQLV